MKLVFLLAVALLACGSSTTETDGGADSSTDGMMSDGAQDAQGSTDTGADAPSDAAKGEAGQGDTCDLQNDQCGPGLKCCTEPTHMMPPTHDICVPPLKNGACPMYP